MTRRVLLLALGIFGAPAGADVLFSDDFGDGVIDPRYTTFGGATMTETGGRLVVELPVAGSGLQIDISEFPTTACFDLRYAIEPTGFPVGTELEFAYIAESNTIPGLDFAAVALSLQRPFWNRCKYKVTQNDNDAGMIGFTGPYSEEKDCPAADRIRLDWLPKIEDPNNPGQMLQRFEIEITGAPGVLKDPIRIEGQEYAAGSANFTHEGNQIKNLKITKVASDESESADAPFTIALDQIVLDDAHQGSGLQSISLVPDVFDRGAFGVVNLITEQPILVPGQSTLNMGPEVFIHFFQVLGQNLAFAIVEVDERARNAGHYVLIETGQQLVSSDFTIRPLDPTQPLPPNQAPTAALEAPAVVPADTPFTARVDFDDSDDQFIQGLMVIMDTITTAEVFASGYFFVNTAGPDPVGVEFLVPGLPAGDYKYVVLANDGLAEESPIEQHLTVASCPWDCGNADGVVSTADLLALLGAWGGSGSCDFDGDGTVGTVDLLKLLANWGPCD